jgi:hypothetical protein
MQHWIVSGAHGVASRCAKVRMGKDVDGEKKIVQVDRRWMRASSSALACV